MVRALARLRVGRPADAAEDAREALDLAQRGGVDVDPRFAGAYLAEALADLGDLDRAEATLESVRGFDMTDPGPAYYARQGSRPGPTRAGPTGRGARRGAGRRAARGRRTASPTQRSGRGAARRRSALHALGEVDEALRLAEEEVAAGPALGRPERAGRCSLRVLGLVSGRTELPEKPAAVLAGSLARIELARSVRRLGGRPAPGQPADPRPRRARRGARPGPAAVGPPGWPPRSAPSCGPPATDPSRAP